MAVCTALLAPGVLSTNRSLWGVRGNGVSPPGCLDCDAVNDAKGHPMVCLARPEKIRTLKLEWKSNAAMLHMNMLPITNKTSQKYTTIMCKLT